jgi:hypothetical protein
VKPTNATINSVWEVGVYASDYNIAPGTYTYNLSIPLSCWDVSPNFLMLQVTQEDSYYGFGGSNTEWNCYNGSAFIQLLGNSSSEVGGRRPAEESMIWNIVSNYTPTIQIIDALNSRAELQKCLIPYGLTDYTPESGCVNVSGYIGTLHMYYSNSTNQSSYVLEAYQPTFPGYSDWSWKSSSRNTSLNYLTYSMNSIDSGLYSVFMPYKLVDCHLSFPPISYIQYNPNFGTITSKYYVAPTGQTSTVPLFNCTNDNSVTVNLSVSTNQTYANVTDFCANNSALTNPIVLNTSTQKIYVASSGQNFGIWCNRNYSMIPNPENVILYQFNYT